MTNGRKEAIRRFSHAEMDNWLAKRGVREEIGRAHV